MKYIMIEVDAGGTKSISPVIFPEWMVHSEVATAMLRALKVPSRIVSAGFCAPEDNFWTCWGKSESLKLDTHPDDSIIINMGDAARFMWSRS